MEVRDGEFALEWKARLKHWVGENQDERFPRGGRGDADRDRSLGHVEVQDWEDVVCTGEPVLGLASAL